VKPFRVLFASWAVAGLGAVVGSILGNAQGQTGLFVGAVLGGVIGVAAAVFAVAHLQWLPRNERAGAIIGGILGFAIATPIAAGNLHTPIIPVASCALVGVGVLLGAGLARGWQRS